MTTLTPELETLREAWTNDWAAALAIWSRFTKLSLPRWCFSVEEEAGQGLSGSFAMIRLRDQAVVVSLRQVQEEGLESFGVEVLAHEIGHHIYVPGNMLEQGRMLARMRKGLPSKEALAPLIANLYADLLLNDRLQRDANLDMAGVYEILAGDSRNRLWRFYMRIYEILWSLPRGSLARGEIDRIMEGDAGLGARLIRSYAREWLDGAGRFAVLALRYLLEPSDEGEGDEGDAEGECAGTGKGKGKRKGKGKGKGQPLNGPEDGLGGWRDTNGDGTLSDQDVPAGLAGLDANEADSVHHPGLDSDLTGLDGDEDEDGDEAGDGTGRQEKDRRGPALNATSKGGGPGQYREPFEYGQILRALGLNLSEHETAVKYYRERALPYLVKFPVREMPRATDPLPEGLDIWDAGESLEKVDWLQSVLYSPIIIPGVTTVQRTWGTAEGQEPEKRPVDLDLYADCSGSMPNPQTSVSYLALAGAIIALSALRVGSRVHATLWSGTNQFDKTNGFVSDATQVLRVLTGYFGGGTAFPIHVLRDTHATHKPSDRAVHVLVISDDGVTTMFDNDERGDSGWDVSNKALDQAGGGGTMVLNLNNDWKNDANLVRAHERGWQIFRVQSWEDLVAFARAFSQAHYGQKSKDHGTRRPHA